MLQTASGSWWWGCVWVGRETSARHLPHPTFCVSVNPGASGRGPQEKGKNDWKAGLKLVHPHFNHIAQRGGQEAGEGEGLSICLWFIRAPESLGATDGGCDLSNGIERDLGRMADKSNVVAKVCCWGSQSLWRMPRKPQNVT